VRHAVSTRMGFARLLMVEKTGRLCGVSCESGPRIVSLVTHPFPMDEVFVTRGSGVAICIR
jgi:hypothetical protein